MQLLLVLLIAFKSSLIAANKYHLCTSKCSGIDLAFADAVTLPAQCQDNENNPEENAEDVATFCSVEYRINYLYERIHVSFNGSNDTEHFHSHGNHPQQHLKQTVSFSLHSGFEGHDETIRRFTCNTKSHCAREFYLKTIGPLLAEGKNKLTLIKNKLYNRTMLTSPSSRRRCIDSDKTGDKPSVFCRTGLCHALFDRHPHQQNNTKTQKCVEHTSSFLRSENEYHLTDAVAHVQKEFLEYRCNKNVCNRNEMIDIVRNLFSEFSHLPTTEESLPSSMHGAAGKHGEEIQKKTNSSTSIQSSLILVLFYLLLQICF